MDLEESIAKAISQCTELEESFLEAKNRCKILEESFAKAISQCKEIKESSEAINECYEIEESSAEAISQCKEQEDSYDKAINKCMEIKEHISKIKNKNKNKVKECHEKTPNIDCFNQPKRVEPCVKTSKGQEQQPSSYMRNGWRNAPNASSHQQQFVGNGGFRYQQNSYTTSTYNSPNLRYQSQWQRPTLLEQKQYETNFQYLNQCLGQSWWEEIPIPRWEAGATSSSQPTLGEPTQRNHELEAKKMKDLLLSLDFNILKCYYPTLFEGAYFKHDEIQALIGDKAPENGFHEPQPALYGTQAPTSLPEMIITPLKGNTDQLSSSFSLLNVDDNGDIQQTTMADTKVEVNGHLKDLNMVLSSYKLPLVWIDLEMTGLDIETDRILEIACIITDGNLTKSIEGPDIVIHQKKECLEKMGEWCQEHHAASGLTEKVTRSTVTEGEAEKQVVQFMNKNIGRHKPLLAGNSVYVDLLFLKKYMPELASLFGHVLVDVSSINALCIRWFSRDHRNCPKKEKKHRAMDDIKESIAELKYYKDNIFKSPSNFNN